MGYTTNLPQLVSDSRISEACSQYDWLNMAEPSNFPTFDVFEAPWRNIKLVLILFEKLTDALSIFI